MHGILYRQCHTTYGCWKGGSRRLSIKSKHVITWNMGTKVKPVCSHEGCSLPLLRLLLETGELSPIFLNIPNLFIWWYWTPSPSVKGRNHLDLDNCSSTCSAPSWEDGSIFKILLIYLWPVLIQMSFNWNVVIFKNQMFFFPINFVLV